MAPKNPLGKITDTALSTLKDPRGAARKVVDQARGTAALGRTVAGQAVSTAAAAVGGVADRAAGRRGRGTDAQARLRPVPDVNEPAHTPAESKVAAGEATAEPEVEQALAGTPPVETVTPVAKKTTKKAPAKKAPAKKTAAKKSPAKKTAAKKSPAKKTAAKKSPAKKAGDKRAASATPADVAEVVESAVAEDPAKTAATPAEPTAESSPGDKLPTAQRPEKEPAEQGESGPVIDESAAKAAASKSETLRKAAEKTPE